MTEAEWLAVDHLQLEKTVRVIGGGYYVPAGITWRVPTDRQFRLLACACFRRLPAGLLDILPTSALDAAEELAEGTRPVEDYRTLAIAARARAAELQDDVPTAPSRPERSMLEAKICLLEEVSRLGSHPRDAAMLALREAAQAMKHWGKAHNRAGGPTATKERKAQLDFMRCILGNPFRPVVFAPEWRTETVVALASGVYAERAFDRLPILADALEEAGCDHADILNHCRGSGSHSRGCWVVDGILGKV